MEQTKFERAKEIEKEIKFLVDYKRTISAYIDNPDKGDKLAIVVMAYNTKRITGDVGYNEKSFGSHYTETPNFLKDEIKFQLESVVTQLYKRINKKIEELEKEFNTL